MHSLPQSFESFFVGSRNNQIGNPDLDYHCKRIPPCSEVTVVLFIIGMLIHCSFGVGLAQNLPPTPEHQADDAVEAPLNGTNPVAYAFSSKAKWKGYLDFLGKPGTARSLGQPDLFLPLRQDANDMTFFNLRGQLQFDDTDVHEYNIGLGHRHMFHEWIIGGYGYFDRRNTQFGNSYNQFTGGVELMSVDWAFRMNGYLPENKTETITSGVTVSVIRPNDQILVQIDGIVQEKALPGLDGEVGYLLPLPWSGAPQVIDETRLYLGGYHFIGDDNFESVTGPRGRLEMRMYDLPVLGPGSRFMMGVEAQWDEPRGSQAFGLVSLRIPFDVFAEKSKRRALKGLDRRMLQPVIRDVDVMTSTRGITEIIPAVDERGDPLPKIFEIDLPEPDHNFGPIRIEIIPIKMYYHSAYLGSGSVIYDPPISIFELPEFDFPTFSPCNVPDPRPDPGSGVIVIANPGHGSDLIPELPKLGGIKPGCWLSPS